MLIVYNWGIKVTCGLITGEKQLTSGTLPFHCFIQVWCAVSVYTWTRKTTHTTNGDEADFIFHVVHFPI